MKPSRPQWQAFALVAAMMLLPAAILNSNNTVNDELRHQADAALTCGNTAVAGVVASGSYRTNVPTNTLDNNFNTRWSNSIAGSWISYNLGQDKMVCYIDIAWFKGNQRSYNFVISVSQDGTTFADIYTGKSTGKSSSLQRYDISDTKAKHVKIAINGNSANSWAEITELDVYGYSPDETPPAVNIIEPASGSVAYAGKLDIKGTAFDNAGGSGVQFVEVRVNNGLPVQAMPVVPGDLSAWTASIDLGSEAEHVIYAKATDWANNRNETSISVFGILDTALPVLQISSPAEGSDISIADGTILVNGTAFDSESGIKHVQIELDNNGEIQSALPLSAGDWSYWSANVAVDANGIHIISVVATDNADNIAYDSVTVNASIYSTALDLFGIEKLYPTSGNKEWYVSMEDPQSDPYLQNLQNLQLTQQPDGSWQVSAQNGQVRMESWSHNNEKWLNVEITEYAKIEQTNLSLLQMYTRGGHHTSSDPCLGSAYKARLYGDGRAGWVKEVTHPAYTSTRGWVQVTDDRLEGRWVGFKAVIYNFVENDNTYVRMESYIDDEVTDSNGNLVIRNNWTLASIVEDRGGWATTNSDFTTTCAPMSLDNSSEYRQADEILSLPGGTGTQNIAGWRTDETTWNFKYLSVREIQAPQ